MLVAAYLLVVKPLIDKGEKATNRVDRIGRCVEHAQGNAHKIFRCGAKF